MQDLLVNLLNLPDDADDLQRLKEQGILVRRIQPYEMTILRKFVLDNFGANWADEVMSAFGHQPITCFVATHEKKIVGFSAYECTRRNFFGPTGVKESHRGRGIGRALLVAALRSMREMGYVYAIIGGVGPTDFYSKCVGAVPIAGSDPGIYTDFLENDRC